MSDTHHPKHRTREPVNSIYERPSLARVFVVLIVLALAAGLSSAYWWRMGRSIPVIDLPTDRLACVSYAPYRRPGQTPFDPEARIAPEQIEEDLRLLAPRFGCVRTYSVDRGLDAVPAVAQRLGVQVMLGIWLGRESANNERELLRGIEVANAHPDTVRAVIVGNEVLLRRELPAAALATAIERVRSAVRQPVTYADVWEFWLKNPELAQATSFVSIHILPYWEDEPVPIEGAVSHVREIYEAVRQTFPGQTILIGETGWPSVGRNRQGAIPSRVNQAKFIREFSVMAAEANLPYNVVEAFDQPWKRFLEGTVGGYWGLYDAQGHGKFAFRGPVVEEDTWWWGLAAAATGAVGLLAVGLLRRHASAATSSLILLFAGAAAGGTLAAQARIMWLTNRTLFEWFVSGVYAVLVLIAATTLALMLAAWAAGTRPLPQAAPIGDVVSRIVLDVKTRDRTELWLGGLRFVFLFGAAAQCLLLVFDSRYRDFPLELLAIPSIGYALLAWASGSGKAETDTAGVEERVLSWGLIASAPLNVANERLTNLHALAWCALCVLFAGSILIGRFQVPAARKRKNAKQEADR